MTIAQVVNSPSLSTTVLFRHGLGYTHRKDHIPPAYEPYKIEYGDQYWMHTSKRARIPEYSRRNLTIARLLVTAVRKNVGGLAVLVSLIVKLSSRANSPRAGRGPPCQSLEEEGAAKAWYCLLVLLWQSQCTRHVCLKFIMSNSFNVWGPLANGGIPLKHVQTLQHLKKFQDKPILRICQKYALQHSLLWRYANFSKIMRTIHTSMTSTF